jgi:DNA repair photolyase
MTNTVQSPQHEKRFTKQAPPKQIRVAEVVCRTILSPSGIGSVGYSLNPYVGCTHNCGYCYAHYMQRYSGHKENWGKFVDAKVNAPQVLVRQLRRIHPSSIFLSSVTDPYQPVEKHYRITRRLIQIMTPLHHSVTIHTKSKLIERDIGLITKLRNVSVTFTIVTGDEQARKHLEPGASPVSERIRVLKKFALYGIKTSVFIGPIIPYVTERGLDKLLWELLRAGVKKILIDDLHYLPRISGRLFPSLNAYRKGLAYKYRYIPENYYQQIAQIVLQFCGKHGIRCLKCF